ncbi:sensor histidine kinase [Streptomyces sp. NBC_01190]|uniref:sensor histidine kinase n=1 Tax=Streptomyces sp. NBC_01190 TaxID=2903767 RepID=UPI003863C130
MTHSLVFPLARQDRAGRNATAPPPVSVNDVGLAALVLVAQALLAVLLPEGFASHRLDALGWAMLVAGAAVLVWRRRAPMLCLLGMVAVVAPYHYLRYIQVAPLPCSAVALYALAVAGPRPRTVLVVPVIVCTMAVELGSLGKPDAAIATLRSAGWIVAFAVIGEVVRMHRIYVAEITDRAERAERTREEEAARRVAEERLRIARDLHDLLAHSITLIGVQTSVAAHILVADPERLDRTAVAGALDAIADTCREARAELRTTLRVLRADGDGPLPGLAGLPSLVKAAEAGGARVELEVAPGAAEQVPPAVGAAAYRIVQESLTNAVRHADAPGPRISVRVERAAAALRLLVQDEGPGGAEPGGRTAGRESSRDPAGAGRGEATGFGILGMRERARSVGGTLTAGPRAGRPGFAVTAELPLGADAGAGAGRGPDRPAQAPASAQAPAPRPGALAPAVPPDGVPADVSPAAAASAGSRAGVAASVVPPDAVPPVPPVPPDAVPTAVAPAGSPAGAAAEGGAG